MGQASAPVRIVLSGYYGYDNLGDEAILAALVQQIRQLVPQAELTALSGNPAATSARLGIRAVHRLDLPAIIGAMRGADVFASGGGSLLQDVTGRGSVPYYLGLVKLAQALGLKTMFIGQGIGPLNRGSSRWMVGAVARGTDALAVRDSASRELLASCGVPLERIALTADPVLALAPAPSSEVEAIWRELGLEDGKPTVAVAIRPWETWFERQLKSFSAVLAQQAEAWGAQVLLLPFHRPDDEVINQELRTCLEMRPSGHQPFVATLAKQPTPEQMIGLLGKVDLLIGMRLHALIMAAAAAVPSIGLVYDPKITAFAEQAGFPTVDSVTALEDSDRIIALMESVWHNRQAIRADLRARQRDWQALAGRNAAIAVGLAPTGARHG